MYSPYGFGIEWIPDPRLHDILITPLTMIVGVDGRWNWYEAPGMLAAAIGIMLFVWSLRDHLRSLLWANFAFIHNRSYLERNEKNCQPVQRDVKEIANQTFSNGL